MFRGGRVRRRHSESARRTYSGARPLYRLVQQDFTPLFPSISNISGPNSINSRQLRDRLRGRGRGEGRGGVRGVGGPQRHSRRQRLLAGALRGGDLLLGGGALRGTVHRRRAGLIFRSSFGGSQEGE